MGSEKATWRKSGHPRKNEPDRKDSDTKETVVQACLTVAGCRLNSWIIPRRSSSVHTIFRTVSLLGSDVNTYSLIQLKHSEQTALPLSSNQTCMLCVREHASCSLGLHASLPGMILLLNSITLLFFLFCNCWLFRDFSAWPSFWLNQMAFFQIGKPGFLLVSSPG